MNFKRSVLIFVDEVNLRRSLALLLDRAGYTVTTVTNTKEALQHLQAYLFDLALVDLKLPQIDSRKIIPTIHQLCPEMPVLILTPGARPGEHEEHIWSENQEYLEKPIDPPRLLARIEAILAAAGQ